MNYPSLSQGDFPPRELNTNSEMESQSLNSGPSSSARQSDGFVNRWSGVQTPSGAPPHGYFFNNYSFQNQNFNEPLGLMVRYSTVIDLDDFRSFLERQLKTKRTTNSYSGITCNFLIEYDGQTITSGVIQKSEVLERKKGKRVSGSRLARPPDSSASRLSWPKVCPIRSAPMPRQFRHLAGRLAHSPS